MPVVSDTPTAGTMRALSNPLRFSLILAIAALSQLAVAYVYWAAQLQFIVLLVLWNLAPFAIAVILFIAGARYAAWGWLIGVALFGLWSVSAVLHSDRSTAALGFMWAPVWSFVLAGPVGAGLAILIQRERVRDSLTKDQSTK